jgi:hypothetical protein
MADDNPKFEIKTPPKSINNCRELYYAENEKNILGAKGFKFTSENKYKRPINIYNRVNQLYSNYNNNKSASKILPEISFNKNNSKLMKSQSQINIYSNYKKNKITLKDNNFSNYKILSNNNSLIDKTADNDYLFSSLSSSKIIKKDMKLSHNNGLLDKEEKGINSYSDLSKMRKNSTYLKSIKNKNMKNLTNIILSKHKFDKLKSFHKFRKFNGLKDYKKNKNKKKKLYYKSYFKGVESVFIKPEQIYDVIDCTSKKENSDYYGSYDNGIKERIEKDNEYKEDEKSLIYEDKEKENLINSKEFNNYLSNKEYFYESQLNKEIFKEKENDIALKTKMNYLKNIAFKKDNIKRNDSNVSDNDDSSSSINEKNNNSVKKKEKENDNIEKVLIGGETYIMKTQMKQIAKKILNKCKVYNEIN